MNAYRLGLSGKAIIFAAKKYKSHRKVPESVLMDVDILSLGWLKINRLNYHVIIFDLFSFFDWPN